MMYLKIEKCSAANGSGTLLIHIIPIDEERHHSKEKMVKTRDMDVDQWSAHCITAIQELAPETVLKTTADDKKSIIVESLPGLEIEDMIQKATEHFRKHKLLEE